jgi:hypothetical protein
MRAWAGLKTIAYSSRMRHTILLAFTLPGLLLLVGNKSPSPQWVGKGKYRVLVRIDSRDLHGRASDEMPTQISITPELLKSRAGVSGRIDVASFEVERYDPKYAQPVKYGKWAYAHADWELPYRWYDSTIPQDYPVIEDYVDQNTGAITYTTEKNWGYLLGTLGEWQSGNLAWTHVQQDKQASFYAIYFDLLSSDKMPEAAPRQGFIGDGTERTTEIGQSTHGLLMGRGEVADWNGDGLPDIIVGGENGSVIWYPNRGTRTEPKFPYAKLMFTAEGKPLAVGSTATPLVVDWDGDGLADLVCGTEWSRVVWFKNIGSKSDPKLHYMGLVRTMDGKPLELPYSPVPETPNIYTRDYHPVLAVADLFGDGRPGLIAGGYVTGRIYYFDNLGCGKDKQPLLKFRGPLEADGEPIDVSWAAAPTLGDFEGHGVLDIISGSMYMDPKGGQHPDSDNYLLYYQNVGTPKDPKFTRHKFPIKGKFPAGWTAAPRAVDINGDGLLDLIVFEDTNFAIYLNVGTKAQPLWEVAPPLAGHWNTNPITKGTQLQGQWLQLMDWNHDGLIDVADRLQVRLNLGKGNPQLFSDPQSLLAPGEKITHDSPTGDPYDFTSFYDLDGDGQIDILYGTHQGNVYFHRNLGAGANPQFDDEGVLLKTEGGQPIKVGPQPGQKWDFDVLQGARTTVAAADFDHDGKMDLVVGDNYGKVRYYRNLTGGNHPVFADPLIIPDEGRLVVLSIADWNHDGWPDVLVGSASYSVVLNSGKNTGDKFLPIQSLNLPRMPFQASLWAVDWNGDGDADILARTTYGYLFWFEASFLEHGYEPAEIISLEQNH